MRTIILDSLLPANLSRTRASEFIAPVLSSPAPMIITAIIETTALLESPLIASFGVTRPKRGRIIIMRMPTTSTRTHSKIKSRIARPKTAVTNIIGRVIFSLTSFVIVSDAHCNSWTSNYL